MQHHAHVDTSPLLFWRPFDCSNPACNHSFGMTNGRLLEFGDRGTIKIAGPVRCPECRWWTAWRHDAVAPVANADYEQLRRYGDRKGKRARVAVSEKV